MPPGGEQGRLVGWLVGLLVLAGRAAKASPGFPAAQAAAGPAGRVVAGLLGQPPQPAPAAGDAGGVGGVGASPLALADIPAGYLAAYLAADRHCPGLRWQLLAAIGKVESDHGRSRAPGVRSGLNRFGCCSGPMQFNVKNGPRTTWDA